MARQGPIKLLTLLIALVFVAAACGSDGDTDAGGDADDSSDTTQADTSDGDDEPDDTTGDDTAGDDSDDDGGDDDGGGDEPYRVALFYPGSNDDLSWSNAWFDGAQSALAANPNLEVEFVELLNDPDAFVQQGSAFADQGIDFLLFAHGAMVDPAIEVAQNFPDTQVCLAPHHPASDATGQPDNLCWIDVAQHNANFLAGAIAALASETGTIGSLNGFEFPALTRQPESFNLGARCVNPDINFTQEYINTWTDTAVAKAAAQSLMAGGADVILSATDQAVLGIIDAAQESDSQAWVVPSYYDSFSIAPDVVLTSAVHGLADVSQAMMERGLAGEIGPASFHEFDATNTPGIAAAPLYDNESALTADELAIVQDIDARVRSGEITIPDETAGDPTIGSVDAGGSIDVTSIGCTPGG